MTQVGRSKLMRAIAETYFHGPKNEDDSSLSYYDKFEQLQESVNVNLLLNEVSEKRKKMQNINMKRSSRIVLRYSPNISSAFLAGGEVFTPNFTRFSHHIFQISNFRRHVCRHGNPKNQP